jgi:hypothetical protein
MSEMLSASQDCGEAEEEECADEEAEEEEEAEGEADMEVDLNGIANIASVAALAGCTASVAVAFASPPKHVSPKCTVASE